MESKDYKLKITYRDGETEVMEYKTEKVALREFRIWKRHCRECMNLLQVVKHNEVIASYKPIHKVNN